MLRNMGSNNRLVRQQNMFNPTLVYGFLFDSIAFSDLYSQYTKYSVDRVHYPSEVNWKTETNYLQCSNDF